MPPRTALVALLLAASPMAAGCVQPGSASAGAAGDAPSAVDRGAPAAPAGRADAEGADTRGDASRTAEPGEEPGACGAAPDAEGDPLADAEAAPACSWGEGG